jgi:hypothetical protein
MNRIDVLPNAGICLFQMSGRIGETHNRLEPRPARSLAIALIGILSLNVYAQSPSQSAAPTSASGSLLSREVVVPLSVVNRFFPEITREATTGQNLTAVGNAKATRSVIYANSDSSKKVTITVDQYASSRDASSAYQEAVRKSKTVPGFKPIPAENLGQNAFIGTVTQGGETHIGLGALDGTVIVGATLAGFDATPDIIDKLISMTREEEGVAKTAVAAKRL